MNKVLLFIVILQTTLLSCSGGKAPNDKGYEIPAPVVSVSNPIPCLNQEVQFYYTSDISGIPAWDFGDGATASDALVKHIYTVEGQYNVTLTLTDGEGGEAVVVTPVAVMGKSLSAELKRLVATPSEIWLCAHRANTYDGKKVSGIPENSLEAIQKAIEVGANMVEIDVRTTSDGHFVLMHDATITRTTNASGNVKDKTLAQLKSYKLRSNSGAITTCTIPTLEEALLAGRGKIYFNLDKVKDMDNKYKLVKLVDSLYMLDRVLFYVSSDRNSGNEISGVNSHCLIFPWASTEADLTSWSSNPLINLVQMNYQATNAAALITAARAKQMISYSNSLDDAGDNALLQNDFSQINQMKNLGLQVIQTDYTEKIKE